jgi:hypothetical protein
MEYGIVLQTLNGGLAWIEYNQNTLRNNFTLSKNYPNPFNPSTTIRYQLPVNAKVSLKIYNTLGQEVAMLINRRETAGQHQVLWNGKDNRGNSVSSGLYLYRMEVVSDKGRFSDVKKMVYLK